MLEFTSEMLMNVPSIDEQHRELIKRVNEMGGIGTRIFDLGEVEKNLVFFRMYIIKHFADEEELQLRIGYPGYERHRGLHQQFVEEYKRFVADYQKNGSSMSFMLHFNRAVIQWVSQHIQEEDLEIARYVHANNIKVD